MTLGEILDRTVTIYRARFLALVGIALIPALAMFSIHLADHALLQVGHLFRPPTQRATYVWNFVVGLFFYHVSTLVSFPMLPALTRVGSGQIMGSPVTSWEAIRFAAARFGGYFWIALLKVLFQLILPEVAAVGVIAAAAFVADAIGAFNDVAWSPAAWAILILPALGAGILFAWIGASLSLAFPVAVIEPVRGFRTLRRSWRLTRGSRGRVFAIWFTILAISWILGFGLQRCLWWIVVLLYWRFHLVLTANGFYVPIALLMNAFLAGVVGPIYPVAATVIYYDQRVRHEGYDIELLMAAAGMDAAPASEKAEATAVQTDW